MERRSLGLHRYSVFVSVATLVLLVAGAMVTSTGSGLSVPDWPLTYGQNPFTFPFSRWVGGIKFEHTHRLIASGVGLLTLILAFYIGRVEDRPWMKKLGLAAALLVILQGVFGGITVRLNLPPMVSIVHATLAQCFFCVTVAIALFTSPAWRSSAAASGRASPLRWISWVLFAAVFAQLLAGAYLRHTGQGLSVHIAGAALVTALSVVAYIAAKRAQPASHGIQFHGKGNLHLVLFQVVLGVASLVLLRHDWPVVPPPMIVPATVSVHLVVGAVLLANSLLLGLWTRRLPAAGAGETQPGLSKSVTL